MHIKIYYEVKINLFAYHTDLRYHHLQYEENIDISKLIAFIGFEFKIFEFQHDSTASVTTQVYITVIAI